MNVDVLGMGAVAMDLALRCETLPQEDGFSFVHEEKWLPGGSCANVLVALACFGANCGIVAQVGDDSYGYSVRTDLNRAGISTEHLFAKKGGVSLHTFVVVAKGGSRAIFVNLGDAFPDLTESLISPAMLEGVKLFYTDMFPAKVALKMARLCQERSIPVVFNLECSLSFIELCGATSKDLEEMLSLCDLFCTGREGIAGIGLAGDEKEAAASVYKRYGPPEGVVVTLGERGVFWIGKGGEAAIPAFTVDAVDTTGAGDAFAGGLIYARFFERREMGAALAFANACGAVKCLQPGPRIKTNKKEIERFMEAAK